VTAPSAPWLAYGACKALWRADPQHRAEVTGSDNDTFTTAEELECLQTLVTTYDAHRGEADTPFDSNLDQLRMLVSDGLANELILFELASRVSPDATLLVSAEERKRIHDFVLNRVFTELGDSPPSKALPSVDPQISSR
jgi:hypothetical protein